MHCGLYFILEASVMNKVNEIDIASERCTVGRPAILDPERIYLHYVLHYMKRFVNISF